MKKSIILLMLLLGTMSISAQSMLRFTEETASYKKSIKFETGDRVFFSQGKNTNSANTCPGSDGELCPFRVQDTQIIVELQSMDRVQSITIYGKSNGKSDRVLKDIAISDDRMGDYKSIMDKVSIDNQMVKSRCGYIRVEGLNLKKGTLVKLAFTTPDDRTIAAPVNISEIYLQ